ncbi:hypothetical protein [Fictibacillus phosphorivorans]|uniref:hypothetical protein n=1 Tax=Fictibacillus phosphorivorans TaxID=1221500 RepID=UPI00203A3E94|nr:hypothetical protein [Fictibacillus phosphorivorans]MCM3717937.1 hypothetical protein [Fictibacillus phosphorivorans]MCM3775386.1 hypothetical protein [Fictibacillus phosphorivorans]
MQNHFIWDEKLGISVPQLHKAWETYDKTEQAAILLQWEKIRGTIPDRIKEIEIEINQLQDRLSAEENFELSCEYNEKIASMASIINDLWLWYRLNQQVTSKMHG